MSGRHRLHREQHTPSSNATPAKIRTRYRMVMAPPFTVTTVHYHRPATPDPHDDIDPAKGTST